jgi:hypothetical protein
MTSVTYNDHEAFQGAEDRWPRKQFRALSSEAGLDGCEPAGWNVQIHLGAHQITRTARYHPHQERRRTPMTQLVFAIPVGGRK